MASLNPISGILGTQKAAHLLRRTTFGPTTDSILEFSSLTADAALDLLFLEDTMPVYPIDPLSGTDYVFPNVKHPDTFNDTISRYTKSWWLENMRSSGTNLSGRMMWFHYTHFPMIMERIESNSNHAINYLRLLRYYALGNFKELTKALIIDNGMLLHLDGHLNIKGVPQENFAREFLELFAVGKGADQGNGNYTTFNEMDVQMATKVLTGWGTDTTFQTIDVVTGIPTGKVKGTGGNSTQHDVSTKQFSAAFNTTQIVTGNVTGTNTTVPSVYQELDDFVDMIFNSPNVAKNVCRRLYRQFVYFNITPEIESDVIEPLATLLINANYNIKSVFETLLKSEHFYDVDNAISADNNIGAIIKSPVDLVIGTLRLFELDVPSAQTDLERHYELYAKVLHALSLQGIEFFEPYDVAGHDAYFQVPLFHRFWISSNYLANRYKFVHNLIAGIRDENDVLLVKLDIVQFVVAKCSNPSNATILVEELVGWLLPITLDPVRFNHFKNNVLLDQLSEINWSVEWTNFVNSSNDSNVRVQLEALAIALMESPEYQLF